MKTLETLEIVLSLTHTHTETFLHTHTNAHARTHARTRARAHTHAFLRALSILVSFAYIVSLFDLPHALSYSRYTSLSKKDLVQRQKRPSTEAKEA